MGIAQSATTLLNSSTKARFDNAVRKMFTVSKEAYLKEEARLKKLRERKKRSKKT